MASAMNRYVAGGDGRTAFQRLHGRRASNKAVEFGERVFYYIPRKLRAKMSLRWRLGMYLGIASHSGEYLIGTWNGDVVRTRSSVLIVESARWSNDLAAGFKVRLLTLRPPATTPMRLLKRTRILKPWRILNKLSSKIMNLLRGSEENPHHLSTFGEVWVHARMSTVRWSPRRC